MYTMTCVINYCNAMIVMAFVTIWITCYKPKASIKAILFNKI